METHWMSSRNMKSMLVLMLLCSSLINAAFTVEQDSWIATALNAVFFLPILLMHSRLRALYPDKNIFDIIEHVFGRVLSFILMLVLTLWGVAILSLMLRNFIEFTSILSLLETPRIILMLVFMIPVIYLAQKGYHVIGRWSFVVCIAIVANIALTILLAFNVIDFNHILPVLDHPLPDIAREGFTIGAIAVGETFMAMSAYVKHEKKQNAYKTIIGGCVMGIAALTIVALRNLLILGPNMVASAVFPTYMAVRIIHIGNFLERIESTISFSLLLMGMTKMAVFLSGTAMGAARLIKIDNYKKLIVPVALLAPAISVIPFENFLQELNFAREYYRISMEPFVVGLPAIIWITAEIKSRMEKRKLQ